MSSTESNAAKRSGKRSSGGDESGERRQEKRKTQQEIAEQLDANQTLSYDAEHSTYTDVTDQLPGPESGPAPGRQVEQERGEPTEAS